MSPHRWSPFRASTAFVRNFQLTFIPLLFLCIAHEVLRRIFFFILQVYEFLVQEAKPTQAVSIIECDMQVWIFICTYKEYKKKHTAKNNIFYTARNATGLLQVVDFTGLLQVVNKLQQICWI